MLSSTRKGIWPWRAVTITAFSLLALLLVASVANGQPSDFRTLTIDLIFGPQGLEMIDAAVVEADGPSYQPFPSVEQRQIVAESVLQALGLADADMVIDAELSDRYHEVGFTIDFSQPFHQGESPMRLTPVSFRHPVAAKNGPSQLWPIGLIHDQWLGPGW